MGRRRVSLLPLLAGLCCCGAADIVQPPCDCIDPWAALASANATALNASGLAVDMVSMGGEVRCRH